MRDSSKASVDATITNAAKLIVVYRGNIHFITIEKTAPKRYKAKCIHPDQGQRRRYIHGHGPLQVFVIKVKVERGAIGGQQSDHINAVQGNPPVLA